MHAAATMVILTGRPGLFLFTTGVSLRPGRTMTDNHEIGRKHGQHQKRLPSYGSDEQHRFKDNTLLQGLYVKTHFLYRFDNRVIGKTFRLHGEYLIRVVRIHFPGADAFYFIELWRYPGDTSAAIDICLEL